MVVRFQIELQSMDWIENVNRVVDMEYSRSDVFSTKHHKIKTSGYGVAREVDSFRNDVG